MLRKIIYIGLILCGLLFTVCNLAAIPIKTETGQSISGYKTASDVSIVNEPTNLATQPHINSELEKIGKRYELNNRKYDKKRATGNLSYTESFQILYNMIDKALAEFCRSLHVEGAEQVSIFVQVPGYVLIELRIYAHKLLETRTEFIKCLNCQPYASHCEGKSLNFQKTFELFEDKNVKLYKRLKTYLAFGEKQQDTMIFIDASMHLIFQMTNECVSLYSTALENDLYYRNIYKKIDTSSRNIEWILEQGRFKEKINTEL